jgi:hypothetical protein
VCRADNLATFMCRLSYYLGTSTSWNPQGLSRPVMGLLYLIIKNQHGSKYHIAVQMQQLANFMFSEPCIVIDDKSFVCQNWLHGQTDQGGH